MPNWSEDEVALLRKLASENTLDDTAKILDRPYCSVKEKAKRAKVKFAKKNAGGKHVGKVFPVWTKEEDERLIRLLPKCSLKKIGKLLGKSHRSIQSRCNKLELNVDEVRLSNSELAEMLGVSVGLVHKYKRKLGLKFATVSCPRSPTDEEIVKMANAIMDNYKSTLKIPFSQLKEVVSAYSKSQAA